MNKPNCYECKHRRNVAGDAHSSCSHPKANAVNGLLAMLGYDMAQAPNNLNVQVNPHGLRNGWANHPINFDPIWIDNCDGFEKC